MAGADVDDGRTKDVLRVLSEVMDPDLGSDIVSLGFVKELTMAEGEDGGGAVVSFNVELTTPACPVKEQFQEDCRTLVEALPWVGRADVTMTAQAARPVSDTIPTGLSRVANIVAVSSCKGGVGKSTTAVNLAYALHQQGAKVGLLDADIYGPSLPTMVKPENDVVEFVGDQIRPLIAHGVKLMSYGFVNKGAAIMRGPMVSQLLQQFVTLTSWGELDYLVIDMPPGTGDVQLTLCQVLNITASVIVTTPQRLSFTDVVKGIDLFDTVNVPSVAVVENMAYYETVKEEGLLDELDESIAGIMALSADAAAAQAVAAGLGADAAADESQARAALLSRAMRRAVAASKEKRFIFGQGHQKRLADMWGISNTVQMPLFDGIAKSGDSGLPFLVSQPEGPLADRFLNLAQGVVREVAKLRFSEQEAPSLSYAPAEHAIVVDASGGPRQTLSPAELRRQCKCAVCVEEFSGRPLLKPEDISEDIRPLDFGPIGKYAVAVTWSDGHSSLYPYTAIVEGYRPTTKRQELLPV